MRTSKLASMSGLAAVALMAAVTNTSGFSQSNFSGPTAEVRGAEATQAKRTNNAPSMASMLRMAGYRSGSGSRGWQRARGPGWTNAHAQRVARKARNVKRHRAQARG